MLSLATVLFSSHFHGRKSNCDFWKHQIRRAKPGSIDSPHARIGKALDGIRHNQVSISYPVVVFHFAGVNLLPPPFHPRSTGSVTTSATTSSLLTISSRLSASIFGSLVSHMVSSLPERAPKSYQFLSAHRDYQPLCTR